MGKLKDFLNLKKTASKTVKEYQDEINILKNELFLIKTEHEKTLDYIDKEFINWYVKENEKEINTKKDEEKTSDLVIEDLLKSR